MKLSDLLADHDHHVIQGDPAAADVRAGIAYDSRRMTPGSMYVAMRGTNADGHRFIPDAVARGAVAVLVDRPIDDNVPPHVCVVRVADTRAAAPVVASRYFGEPARELSVVAVTGTNGKTSVSYMIEEVLRTGLKVCAGVIGTDGYRVGHETIKVDRTTPTTPESVDLHHILRLMRDRGAGTVIMEASSMALTLHRVDCADIDVGVFTNLTPDHLDNHGSMEQYKAAKLRLFDRMCHRAVANADDLVSADIAALMPGTVTTFGIDNEADFRATDLVIEPAGTRFILHHDGRRRPAKVPVPGRFAVHNALATVATCHLLGHDVHAVLDALASLPPIPGRFETFQTPDGVSVIVDYAHSPDSLEKVLTTIGGFARRRIITVLGAGGDRDTTKRAPMGQIAGKHSDLVVVTNDNPRGEDPEAIADQIISGVARTDAEVERILDREAAIRRALTVAEPEDTVLIAGKGAEPYQIIGAMTVHFNDMETVRKLTADLSAS
ncbi:UDP-N-acetylmuramoyl-L-alanyl-D-glutamate--2,6-diaminopimelate ligase [Streptosporangium sp. 'caverna']|uniref:UDP-N-acetylmuramoyl-L-alanyl-D-glutamate--2, 6-diaminopimelate ligase n=1 Tax=Streptosporangium sp. 'caverna' TaxID=2202249 RepID=UPI000D7EA8BD|nr:UDP-N-acetylmuramoyl-L-alanyl-D-glutamate--2,6-diaminopimelate ligase [Streptosporangium sp. 'caverna']AWS43171.1 UDP-N-acetylmuramoyl-L-alanyl-D-glutamate--2,6-diaminopimelate ligase [Streptosporangium sp. 'caverna']